MRQAWSTGMLGAVPNSRAVSTRWPWPADDAVVVGAFSVGLYRSAECEQHSLPPVFPDRTATGGDRGRGAGGRVRDAGADDTGAMRSLAWTPGCRESRCPGDFHSASSILATAPPSANVPGSPGRGQPTRSLGTPVAGPRNLRRHCGVPGNCLGHALPDTRIADPHPLLRNPKRTAWHIRSTPLGTTLAGHAGAPTSRPPWTCFSEQGDHHRPPSRDDHPLRPPGAHHRRCWPAHHSPTAPSGPRTSNSMTAP